MEEKNEKSSIVDVGIKVTGIDEMNQIVEQLEEKVKEVNELANKLTSLTFEIKSECSASD